MIGRRSTNHVHSSISVLFLNVPDSAVVKLSGIAVDVAGEKLYYCDDGKEPKIGELSIGADSNEQRHRIVFTERTMRPRAVAVYDVPRGTFPDSRL